MYLLRICFVNARENGTGESRLGSVQGGVAKWTILPADPPNRELLRLVAAACGGAHLAPEPFFALDRLCRTAGQPLHVEVTLALHGPLDIIESRTVLRGTGVQIDPGGRIRHLRRRDYRFLSPSIPSWLAKTGKRVSWLFLLAYGPEWCGHDGTDDFDYADPLFRLTRVRSLFSRRAKLTDPAAFLTRIHYRGVKCGRIPPAHVLERLARCCREHLDVDTEHWLEKSCDFSREWLSLTSSRRHAVLPALDAARHLLDAYPGCMKPLDIRALMLLDRPDPWGAELPFSRWAEFMDQLFPEMQFVAALPGRIRRVLPASLLSKTCPVTIDGERPVKSPARLPPKTILLWDVDSRWPNLALMKLSTHFKNQGRRVVLARGGNGKPGVEAVHASCVFNRTSSQRHIESLRKHYTDALVVGGSGVDVHGRLPEHIESLPADYTLYPELGDRAIGFLTRGCPFQCPFCIVPVKEGKPRQVAELDELLDGRQKLILLDDNILAHPRAADLLEEMARRDLQVNFSQSLDLRLVDEETAGLLKRIRCSNPRFTRRVFHFSLNDHRNPDEVRTRYAQFGFRSGDNVEFLCMYGFNTTLAEDVERFRLLRSLPGAYVFVQEYQPILGGPAPNLPHFFDEHADERIDELIRITFTQNMKSMEQYYKWVARCYARTCGRIHQGLVDVIFRYNHRRKRGAFLAALAEMLHKDGRAAIN